MKVYDGVCAVYLQGKKALEVSDAELERIKRDHAGAVRMMVYDVGSAASGIKVIDYRQSVNRAAIMAILGGYVESIATKFCDIAAVRITGGDNPVIELRDTNSRAAIKTLWLGSVDDGTMDARSNVLWQTIKPNEGFFAFVSIVE